jgi:hypothetical protein
MRMRIKIRLIFILTYQMKSFNLNNISDDKLKEAFDLLDKLFKL